LQKAPEDKGDCRFPAHAVRSGGHLVMKLNIMKPAKSSTADDVPPT
jgi:hypothetical protein